MAALPIGFQCYLVVIKIVGFWFQLNIFNDSYYRNAVEMYDGEYFDHSMLIGQISANSTLLERKQLYQTSKMFDTMGIRVTGSPADGGYGFIAEVVTLPLSPTWRPDLGENIDQFYNVQVFYSWLFCQAINWFMF